MGKSIDPVSMLVSPVTSLATSGINAASQSQTNKMNLQMMREQNQFNHDEAALQFDREKEMFNLENQYNNPVEVVSRLRSAGINPAVAMSGSLGSAMSSAASGGQPVAASAAGYPAQMVSPFSNFATGVLDSSLKASQILKSMADAKKVGIDTKLLEDTFDSLVQKADAEGNLMDTKAAVESIFARPIAEATHQNLKKNLEKTKMEIEELGSRILLQGSQHNLNYAAVVKSQYEINEIISRVDLNMKQKELLQKQINTWLSLTNSQIALNYANAHKSTVEADWQRFQNSLMSEFGRKEIIQKLGSQKLDDMIKLMNTDQVNNVFQYVHRIGMTLDSKDFNEFMNVVERIYFNHSPTE